MIKNERNKSSQLHRHSISHVLLAVIISLSIFDASGFSFISPRPVPLPILGFSLVGFTLVPPFLFLEISSLWHFYSLFHRPKPLGRSTAVLDASKLGLMFSTNTNTTTITGCASMDFPLQVLPAAITFRVKTLFVCFLKNSFL